MSDFEHSRRPRRIPPTAPLPTASFQRELAVLDGWRRRLEESQLSLSHGALAGEVVRASIASGLLRLLRNDPEVRLGVEAEAVHQARVATRRLRADLKTFAPLLQGEWAAATAKELGWLGDTLGAVRDGDVLVAGVAGLADALEGLERALVGGIVDELSRRRRESYGELIELLSTERYLALTLSLGEAALAPRLSELASRPAHSLAKELVGKCWQRLERTAARAGSRPTDPTLHKLRIRAKELRYACEALAPVAPPVAVELGQRAKELQGVLGRHQDGVELRAFLRLLAAQRPDLAQACGLCLSRGIDTDRSEGWREVLARLEKRKLRSWLD